MTLRAWALVAVALITAACGQDGELKEIERQTSGNVEVVLLSRNDAIRQQNDTCVIEFRSVGSRELVDVGDVRGTATMPMAGMAPMAGGVDIKPTATKGRYEALISLSMAGDWRISFEWDGPAGRGSVSISTAAQ
jgi:hypothetical protein